MKKNIFLLFFFITFAVCSQEKKDSVSFYLENAKGKNKLSYLKKAMLISEELGIDSLIKQTNIKYGIQCYFNKDITGLTETKDNLLNLYLRNKDSFSLAKVHHYNALLHRLKFATDSAFYYYHKSKNISIQIKDSLETGRRLLSMANMQRSERDFLGSEITTIEGLKYLEPIKNYTYINPLYINLGLVLTDLKRFKEARVYYNKAKNLNKFNTNNHRRHLDSLNILNNIGITLYEEGKLKKASLLYRKALTIDSLEIKFPYQHQLFLENLSVVYLRQKKALKAIELREKVLKSREKIRNFSLQSTSHTLLAEAYLRIKNFTNAKYHAQKGLELAKKTRNNTRVLDCLIHLSNLSKGEESKEYLTEYIQLKNKLISRERNLKNQFAKVRYETEKKEQENAVLKVENDRKQLEIESEEQQKIIGWLVSGASLLFILVAFLIVSNRRKKLLFEAKLQQVEAREKERQQIAKSLHDEVAGDIRMLHFKLAKTNQKEAAKSLDIIKENVRNLSHQLSSESFEDVPFKDQVINLIADYFEIDFKIKVEDIENVKWKEIDNSIKRIFFLAIRESIQNSKKYAEANLVKLKFHQTKKAIVLEISDNGKGFDVTKKKTGIGLKNMKERVEEINGIFLLESELEKGTKTTLKIPKNGN